MVDPAPHEVGANLIFTEEGLSPYFGLYSVTRGTDYGEPITGEFNHTGEPWTSKLKPKGSGLGLPVDPDFRFDFDAVKEFSLKVTPANPDNGPDERKATFTVSPRWPDMVTKDGEPFNTPNITGVNVRVDGSNLELDTYPVILRKAMDVVGVRPMYFEMIHPTSNIWRYESYVRVRREKAEAVVGRDGTFERIYELVGAGDGSFRELREDDGKVEGYHHRVTFDTGGAAALLDGHSLGKQLKHYHPKNVRNAGSDDPLAHPKVGACYLSKRTDGGAVQWNDHADLIREVDETLINGLLWSGLPTRASEMVYVADAHFSVTESKREVELIDDPLPEIRRTQRGVVDRNLTARPGLNDSDMEALEILADDGRQMHIYDLAEEAGVSERTIYRVVDRLKDLLRVDGGIVEFESTYLKDAISDTLSDLARSFAPDGETHRDDSAWVRLMNRYGIEAENVDRESGRLRLTLATLRDEDPQDVLKDLYWAWINTGRNSGRFQQGRFAYSRDGYSMIQEGFRLLG